MARSSEASTNLPSTSIFSNRTVLVTGSAQGIGFAIAQRFLEAGAKVAFNDISAPKIEEALKQLHSCNNTSLLVLPADVRSPTQCQVMIQTLVDHWGHIDIVVNNAGIYPSSLVLDMSERDWDTVMDTNVKSLFLVSQAAAQDMITKGVRGHIINISSGSYHRGRVGSAHYCASKAAGVMFTKVLAMELAPHGIRVNVVAPGLIDTNTLDLNQNYIDSTLRQIPSGRLGTPEDIAAAVLGLASMESDYITGAVLAVDGGLALGRYGIPVG